MTEYRTSNRGEMRHFFQVYKQLEGKPTTVDSEENRKVAIKVIANSIKNYEEKISVLLK